MSGLPAELLLIKNLPFFNFQNQVSIGGIVKTENERS